MLGEAASAFLLRVHNNHTPNRPQLRVRLEGAPQGGLSKKTALPDTVRTMLAGMEPRSLAPSQTAEVLGVSTRTLRRYSTILSNSLSESSSKRGKKRYYNSQDVETLRRAQRMMRQGMTLKDIAEVLPIQPANDVPDTAMILSSEQAVMVGAAYEAARRLEEDHKEHDERIAALERWSRLPWWKKITSSPESD